MAEAWTLVCVGREDEKSGSKRRAEQTMSERDDLERSSYWRDEARVLREVDCEVSR